MAHPVTTNGAFNCAHSGKGQPGGTSKLTVDSKPVLPFSAAAGVTAYPGCINPGNAGGPCATTAPMPPTGNPGASLRLTVGQAPVLLDGLTANTNPPAPPGTPLTSVDAGQTRLTAT